jgi:hypothetical protein
VIATIDSSASGDIAASVLLNVCAVGKEAEVKTFDHAGVAADRPFYVRVN